MSLEFSDKSWDWKSDKLFDMIYQPNKDNINVLEYTGPIGYFDFFSQPIIQKIFLNISDTLFNRAQSYIIYPPMEDCLRALYTKEPKVILLGMDPYHNEGSAVGLCFSLPKNIKEINPSFKSIQKEIKNNGFNVNLQSGNISNWSEQGVILLNTALTVEKGDPGSHLEYWSDFTQNLLEFISNKHKNIIALLWGKDAQSYQDNIKSNYIIKTSHPMPLAAYKSFNGNPAFIGSNCFNLCNEYLQKQGKKSINWSIN